MSNSTNYLESQLYKIRHSAAHIMAQAVLEIFPEGRVAIGPPIDDGFYYDFDLPRPLNDDDLTKVEARMKEIVRGNHTFTCEEKSPADLRKLFSSQPYKLELIEDIIERGTDEYGASSTPGAQAKLTIYKHATFTDLCRGPHVKSTAEINPDAIKLLRVAGAYWRGDEARPMLQRIYGTAWETKAALDEYLNRLEEAKKRDHRLLGKNLDLFSFSDDVGPGLALWHPKGAMVRHLAERFSQDAHLMNGYDWVVTPHIGKSKLWETSGHLDFYKDSMYRPIDIEGEQYYLKPMNCPFHIQIFSNKLRSYREMPKRFAEFGTVYRFERSGVVSGFTRVRGFTQDDAHIFCRPDQVQNEIANALRFSLYVIRNFGLTQFKAYISTKPKKKSVGSQEDWDMATETLKAAITAEGIPYEIDDGGGAFYGPKIDLKLLDTIGREWQLSTVQFDFNLPVRFNLQYIGEDGQPKRPYMVHRALFGSMERFFAMLVEHYAGALPLWLSPTQVVVVPIADRHMNYAYELRDALSKRRVRVEVDDGADRMQNKIRNAEMQKVPFILVLGDKEVAAQQMAVRSRAVANAGTLSFDDFMKLFESQIGDVTPKVLAAR